jgi:hypothetical protein
MKTEIWKSIAGLEGYYEVSSFGRVRSLDRYVKSKTGSDDSFRVGRILRPSVSGRYKIVSMMVNGKAISASVHRLVAVTFLVNEKLLPFVNHKDWNKHNNHVDNLEWCTAKENSKHGSGRKIKRLPRLTKAQTTEIRSLVGSLSIKEIAKKFDRSTQNIIKIKNYSYENQIKYIIKN